jgi:DUF4097 and DUF4098 domain-containing protein YvlB
VKKVWQLTAVLITVAGMAAPLWAQKSGVPRQAVAQESKIVREGNAWVQVITGSVGPARSLRVQAEFGNVNVHGGGQAVTFVVRKRAAAASEAEARRLFESYQIAIARVGDSATFEGTWEGRNARHFNVEFQIEVPRAIEAVKVSTDGGNVSVVAVNGQVKAESGGGNVNLDDVNGAATAETGGGNINVGTAGSDLVLKSGGGNIRITAAKGRVLTQTGGGRIVIGSSNQNLVAETGGGGIQVNKCGGELKLSTGGGSLDVGDVNGRASMETGGGSIRLSGASGMVVATSGGGSLELFNLAHGARAETGAGTITAEFLSGRGGFADSSLQTSAGDVVVYLPRDLRVTVRAAVEVASGHSIRSDFPELKITSEGSNWGPRTLYAEGALNGGGPVLKLRTTTGDIEVRRSRK